MTTTSTPDPARVCELCGAPMAAPCSDPACELDPAVDGEPGKGCDYFGRWSAGHCYGCGRHYSPVEAAQARAELYVD